MRMETAPFEMAEPEVIFELVIISLDAPAQCGDANALHEGCAVVKRSGRPFSRRSGARACLGARERLHFRHMGHTITVRLPKELAAWLEQVAAKTGVPQGKVVRDQLEKAKTGSPRQSFMRLAGSVRGPRDLSSRKGFARS